MAHVWKFLKLTQNWGHLRKPTKPKYLELGSEFRVQTLQFTPSPELRPRTRALESSLHTTLSLSLWKMWASAEGGPPEVTLETSMGSFTVEVLSFLFNYLLFGCSESHRKSNEVLNWVFFFFNVTLFWLLMFECQIN